MADPFEQVIREVEARQLRHAQLSQTAAEKTMQWACTTAAIEADDILSILRRHQQAWREANAAQPRPVPEQVKCPHCNASIRLYPTASVRGMRPVYVRCKSCNYAICKDELTRLIADTEKQLAAADACERHAAQEGIL